MVDIINTPNGRERLLQLGARMVPALSDGEKVIVAQDLDQVARFIGLESAGLETLAPDVLYRKWLKVLRIAQRYDRQMTNELIAKSATHNRPRPIRLLCHHVFRIGEAYLECLEGAPYSNKHASKVLEDGTFTTGEELARYGEDVITRLDKWWSSVEDKSLRGCRQDIPIFYGRITAHQLLERCTWHSAQHTRQLADVLQRNGITPDGELTKEDLAGLPMPERLWE